MHDLLVFFSTLGGLSVFGVMGFIIGPVLAALFVSLLEFYSLSHAQEAEKESHRVDTPVYLRIQPFTPISTRFSMKLQRIFWALCIILLSHHTVRAEAPAGMVLCF